MTGADDVGQQRFPTPQEIARRLFLFGRDMYCRQGSGAVQHGELPGVPSVGLNTIPRAAWNRRGRDDLTGHILRVQIPL